MPIDLLPYDLPGGNLDEPVFLRDEGGLGGPTGAGSAEEKHAWWRLGSFGSPANREHAGYTVDDVRKIGGTVDILE